MFLRRFHHVARIKIDGPPERVWAVIRPSENAPTLDPRCVEAWTRMPAGPGGHEVQVQVLVWDDVRYRCEFAVVEEDPPHFARTEWVSCVREDPYTVLERPRGGSEFNLQRLPDGRTLYEHRFWEEARRWRLTAAERGAVETSMQEGVHRTRDVCEAAG
ncbi:hypothetical protein GCM10009623_05230 [Nocardioides aestuarii]|uniref:SRPBCC family protein n=1 Tax=Nocardioides aestuarii TaxID=252231 RepID=A0ABW4THW8_9ACTN